jgi:hypothetical protein
MQGNRGPALIGYGATEERNGVYNGRPWRDINFEQLVDPAVQVLASKEALFAIRDAVPWLHAQTSGVLLPRAIAAKMESLAADGSTASGGKSRDVPAYGLVNAEEGDLRLRSHYIRERNRRLVSSKIREALERHGKVECEVCNSDLARIYGDWGNKAIECHHKIPLGTARKARNTYLKDLALICANCHRVLHGGEYDLSSLRTIIKQMRRYPR